MNGIKLFFETIKGLFVTGKHFVVNFFFHVINYVFRIKTKRRGSVTLLYPEEKRQIPPRYRALHRLMYREDGKPRCVGCMLCVSVCPSECIYVEAGEVDGEKVAVKFEIDATRCAFCGYCVEACPEDAIRMDTAKIDYPSYKKEDLIIRLNPIVKEQP